jgi:hypothetical protein
MSCPKGAGPPFILPRVVTGMTILRLFLILLWVAIAAVTLWALAELGPIAATTTFLSDLSHPWRAQFYADLEAHLLLIGAWMIYRERSRGAGVVCALLTLLLGALFSLPYVLQASLRARGDARRLLLGARADAR